MNQLRIRIIELEVKTRKQGKKWETGVSHPTFLRLRKKKERKIGGSNKVSVFSLFLMNDSMTSD